MNSKTEICITLLRTHFRNRPAICVLTPPALSPLSGEGAAAHAPRNGSAPCRVQHASSAEPTECGSRRMCPLGLRRPSRPLSLERILPSKSSRIEPLNRSRRRKEALTSFPRKRVSLLTSAATRFMGRAGYSQISLREMAAESCACLCNKGRKMPEGSGRRRGEPCREAGLFAIGGAGVDHAALGGLVERGTELAVGVAGVLLLATLDRLLVGALQRLEAGLDAAVVQPFALAVAHAAFGGPGVRHIRRKSVFKSKERTR